MTVATPPNPPIESTASASRGGVGRSAGAGRSAVGRVIIWFFSCGRRAETGTGSVSGRPGCRAAGALGEVGGVEQPPVAVAAQAHDHATGVDAAVGNGEDRKSTRLNSSHVSISYAVFCLKKKTTHILLLIFT